MMMMMMQGKVATF